MDIHLVYTQDIHTEITHFVYVKIMNVMENLDHGESMLRYLGKLEYCSTIEYRKA
jgi:hypothetical protein